MKSYLGTVTPYLGIVLVVGLLAFLMSLSLPASASPGNQVCTKDFNTGNIVCSVEV